jgi:hypothetical protein
MRLQVRATDVVIGELWQRRKDRTRRPGKFNRIESTIGKLADPAVFALSAACIMYAWIYTPEKLPPFVVLNFPKSLFLMIPLEPTANSSPTLPMSMSD